MSCEYIPVLKYVVESFYAEPETTGTLEGFFVDVDE